MFSEPDRSIPSTEGTSALPLYSMPGILPEPVTEALQPRVF